ncbi:MAG: hypothetical protein LUG96_10030 [Tannerellaceae bacterium]|nr:hypothetical protein [Tannerellaceae bacterium]
MNKLWSFLFFLFVILSVPACHESGDMPVPGEGMVWKEGSLSSPIFLYGYQLPDVQGFERHPLIEETGFYEPVVMEVAEHLTFRVDYQSVSMQYADENSREKGLALLEEINRQGSSLGKVWVTYDTDHSFLAGIKNNKLWLGQFTHDRIFVQAWESEEETDRTQRVETGYGGYEEHYARSVSGYLYQIQDQQLLQLFYADEQSGVSGAYGFAWLNDRIRLLDLSGIADLSLGNITPWYDSSVLLVFANDRQAVVRSADEIEVYTGFLASYTRFSVSPTEYFAVSFSPRTTPEISFSKLGNREATFSRVLTPYLYLMEDEDWSFSEITYTGETHGLFTFRIDLFYYTGEKKSISFGIDREGNLFE